MTSYVLISIALLLSTSLNAQPNVNQSTARNSVARLRNQIEQIARAAQGRVGVAATLLETGESVDLHGDESFPMQSVYKFPIGMTVLQQVDAGKLRLNQKIQVTPTDYISERQHSPIRDTHPTGTELTLNELLRYAVSESDGSASDVLMRLAGGPQAVMNYLKTLGVTGLIVADTEKEIGRDHAVQYRNWAKPSQAVRLLRALQEGRGLSKTSRAHLLQRMTDTQTGLHRLKGLLPAGTVVAHKTGSSGTVNGVAAATNDVGLITLPNGRHIAIAVFVSDSKADDATRERVIAKVAKAVWDAWK